LWPNEKCFAIGLLPCLFIFMINLKILYSNKNFYYYHYQLTQTDKINLKKGKKQ